MGWSVGRLVRAVTLAGAIMGVATGPAAAQSRTGGVDVPGYDLRATDDGGYAYDQEAWLARIGPDGTVRFKDRPAVLSSFKGGFMEVHGGKRAVPEPSLGEIWKSPSRDQVLLHPWAATRAPISPWIADIRTACEIDDPCYYVPTVPVSVPLGVGAIVDGSDIALRALKHDPYRLAKANFLDATRELRTEMASRYRGEVLAASLGELPSRLERLWADPVMSPAEKRRVIAQWWLESTGADGAPQARAIIERFVRVQLPPGSASAYTPGELARVGGGFDPYGP
jgi:hypothetical protein